MSAESAGQIIGEAPLAVLVGGTEEKVRLLAEHLDTRGVLDDASAALLAEVRVRLLVATSRLEGD